MKKRSMKKEIRRRQPGATMEEDEKERRDANVERR